MLRIIVLVFLSVEILKVKKAAKILECSRLFLFSDEIHAGACNSATRRECNYIVGAASA